MLNANNFSCGQVVRLTTPYFNAQRGLYKVAYVYSNYWLGVICLKTGQQYDVPSFVCRTIDIKDEAL